MPIRTRTRYPGDIDPALGQTTSVVYLPYWVSGRYYEAVCPGIYSAPTTTSIAGTALIVSPFIVPNAVTVTAIGLEVTTGGAAGNTMRLGIYDTNLVTGRPEKLLIDSGALVIDATGFQSASISLVLEPGLYWSAHCATATASYRILGTGSIIQFISIADTSIPSNTYGTCLVLGNGAGTVFASDGIPLIAPRELGSTSTNIPRVLLGV